MSLMSLKICHFNFLFMLFSQEWKFHEWLFASLFVIQQSTHWSWNLIIAMQTDLNKSKYIEGPCPIVAQDRFVCCTKIAFTSGDNVLEIIFSIGEPKIAPKVLDRKWLEWQLVMLASLSEIVTHLIQLSVFLLLLFDAICCIRRRQF